MGPPAPRSPTSPRDVPTTNNTSPLKGSPLRPPSLQSPFRAGFYHQQPKDQPQEEEDDDEIVPETQSESPAARPFVDLKTLKSKRPPPFRPVLSPVVASGTIASSSKPRRSGVSGFSGSGFAGVYQNDNETDDSPSTSTPASTDAPPKPPSSRPASAALTTTKLEEFGFSRKVQRRPLDRGARSEDEDVSASDDDEGGGGGTVASNSTGRADTKGKGKGKGKEKEKSSPFEVGGKILKRVPSPPPLSAVKPAPLRRRNAAQPPISYSPQLLDSQFSFPPEEALPSGSNPCVVEDQQDDASDTESHVSSSQTQLLAFLPKRRADQDDHQEAGLSNSSSLRRRRVGGDVHARRALRMDEDDDDDERVPSSQADDVAGPSSSLRRNGFVEEKEDLGYETDESEIIPASDASPSPLSFRFVRSLLPFLPATQPDLFTPPFCPDTEPSRSGKPLDDNCEHRLLLRTTTRKTRKRTQIEPSSKPTFLPLSPLKPIPPRRLLRPRDSALGL